MIGRRHGFRRARTRVGSRIGHLESLESRQLLATFTVTNTASTGAGSLSAAISAANATFGLDRIAFNIPGSGFQVISGVLPAISDPLELDGTSQPGFGARPLIVLDGTTAGAAAVGLQLQAATTVKGLTINNFGAEGIRVQATANGSTIQQSYIGTDPTGATAAPNAAGIVVQASDVTIGGVGVGNVISGNGRSGSVLGDGIRVEGGTTVQNTRIAGNRIGTSADGTRAVPNTGNGIEITLAGGAIIGAPGPGGRNIISGNGANGIEIFGSGVSNTIFNNYIGTDVNGLAAIPNARHGVDLFTNDTQVGGAFPGSGNVISGNTGAGIRLFVAQRTTVAGNLVGVAADGVTALGNKDAGISIQSADFSQIGGTLASAGNVIAYNGSTASQEGGINIFSGRAITIRGNRIYENTGRGIRFFTVSGNPPPNDLGDVDSGVNDLQNFPILASADSGGGRTRILGTLSSTPDTTYTLEFFANTAADPSGNGEGESPLGTVTVLTDSNGVAAFNVLVDTPATPGAFLTATATDLTGNTSEFSAPVTIAAAPVADLVISNVVQGGPGPAAVGQAVTYLVTVRNNGPDAANNVAVVDTIPDTFTNLSVTSSGGQNYNIAGNVVSATFTRLAPGEVATLAITAVPTVVGVYDSTATITGLGEIDSNPLNDSATQTTTVILPVDLEVEIEADLPPGQTSTLITEPITYLVSLVNTRADVPAAATATGVTLSINLPTGATVVNSTSSQGTVVQEGDALVLRLPSLAIGNPVAVSLVVQPTQAGPATLTATATAGQPDLDPADNTAILPLTVIPAADLALAVEADSPVVFAGQPVTLTLTALNNGPSDATGVRVVNVLPAGLTFVGSPTHQGAVTVVETPAGQQVTVDLGQLASGAVAAVQIVARADATGLVTNVATIASSLGDQDASNNTAAVALALDPADLDVTIVPSTDAPASGQPLTYFITVTNNGPATARNVVLTDVLPGSDRATFRSATLGGVSFLPENNVLTVPLGELGPNAAATLTVVVEPTAGGILSNLATVRSDQADLTPASNTASVVSAVDAADIAVEVTGPSGVITVGTPQTYRVTVRNFGPLAASGLTIQAGIPAGARFVSASPGSNVTSISQVGDSVAALISQLPSGGTATFTLQLVPTAVGTLGVTAGYDPVGAGKIDPNAENNGATTSNPVVNLPGVIQFAQAVYETRDNARSLLVTVARTGGTQGTLTATYRTAPGTAAANVNYRPVSGTLTFGDGEFEKTFSVPILADGKVTGTKTFSLALAGATLGAQRTAQVRMTETDVDAVGPKVTGIQLLGGSAVTGFVLSFDEPLAASRANAPSNYVVYVGGNRSRPIAARAASYNNANRTVTVQLASALPSGPFNQFVVNGTGPRGVTDVSGNLLDGNADGRPGGNYAASYARAKNVTYVDGDGDTVNLRLAGPGNIEILRGGTGDSQLVRLPGGTSRSTLSGSVRRGRSGDGITNLGRVENLGVFQGGVRSRLTSRPFYAENTPALLPGAAASAPRRLPGQPSAAPCG